MRTIGVITTSRADFGIYLPILRRIRGDSELRLRVIATGMHLSNEFGLTARLIEQSGFDIAERVEMLLSSDTPEATAKSMGLGTLGFAQLFSRWRPDILMVLGDRFEMHAAALAAVPFGIPLAHLHGGELTLGAMDEVLRHSLTKLSHLHFVATADSARRVRQLGEEPWRVVVSGAPSLENLDCERLLEGEELDRALGFNLERPFLLVTFHPTTLQGDSVERHGQELLWAVEELGLPALFTMPNADAGGRELGELIRQFVAAHQNSRLMENLGTQLYFSTMAQAAAMLGNSSSGLIEAPSFGLPVVNVGIRQAGRVRGRNVIDVAEDRAGIVAGLRQALSSEFRKTLQARQNPYRAEAPASQIIVDRLRKVALDEALRLKRFHDLAAGV